MRFDQTIDVVCDSTFTITREARIVKRGDICNPELLKMTDR